MRRRSMLSGLASLGLSSLAGCNAQPNPSSPTPSSTTPPRVIDSAITTTQTGCRSTESEHSTVETRDDQLVIEGVGVTSTPCHQAHINTTEITDHTLSVTLGFESTDAICIECIGAVTYRATITVSALETLETVRVTHTNSDHHHTATLTP